MQLIQDNEAKKIKFSGDIKGLLKHLNMMREEVVVKVNGKLVPDTKELKDDDEVEVIKVVFGG